jgi:hypothetical protein
MSTSETPLHTLSLTDKNAKDAHTALTLLCPDSPLLTLLRDAFPELSAPTPPERDEALRTLSGIPTEPPTDAEVESLQEFLALTQPRCDLFITHLGRLLGNSPTSVDVIAILYAGMTLATSAAVLGELHPRIQAHIIKSVWTLITLLPDVDPPRVVELFHHLSESELDSPPDFNAPSLH